MSINSTVVSIDRTAVGIKASNYAVAGAALTAANSLQSIYNKLWYLKSLRWRCDVNKKQSKTVQKNFLIS